MNESAIVSCETQSSQQAATWWSDRLTNWAAGLTTPPSSRTAREQQRIAVTYNNADFMLLGEQRPEHPGILRVYQDNKPNDMKISDIVKAIANVDATYSDGIAGKSSSSTAFAGKATTRFFMVAPTGLEPVSQP